MTSEAPTRRVLRTLTSLQPTGHLNARVLFEKGRQSMPSSPHSFFHLNRVSMQSRFTTACPVSSMVGRLLHTKGTVNRKSHTARKANYIRFLDRAVGHMLFRSLPGSDWRPGRNGWIACLLSGWGPESHILSVRARCDVSPLQHDSSWRSTSWRGSKRTPSSASSSSPRLCLSSMSSGISDISPKSAGEAI